MSREITWAWCCWTSAGFEEAAAHFRKVTEVRPDVVNAFSDLGLALTQLKRFDEALTVFDRAVKLDPSFAEALNNRGNALRQLGRLEQALRGFRSRDRAQAGLCRRPRQSRRLSRRPVSGR